MAVEGRSTTATFAPGDTIDRDASLFPQVQGLLAEQAELANYMADIVQGEIPQQGLLTVAELVRRERQVASATRELIRHLPELDASITRSLEQLADRQSAAIADLAAMDGQPYDMRLIARRTLKAFIESRAGHHDQTALKVALDAWFDEVRKAHWLTAADVKRLYASASVVSADRIVFNVKGNDYRLVTAVDFEKGIVWIKWIGAHREYNRINVREVEYERD